jgi:hypothetical protein
MVEISKKNEEKDKA